MASSNVNSAPWSFPGLQRDTFAGTSFALASTRPYQYNTNASFTEDEEFDSDGMSSDDDSIHPRDLARARGKAKLRQKFLNRLAEVMARQKTKPRGYGRSSRRQELNHRSDADYVSAAMLAFRNQKPVVLVAKNTGLKDEEDVPMLEKIRTFLRIVSHTGQRRPPTGDKMLAELVKFNNKRIEYYVEQLQGNKTPILGSEPEIVARILKKCADFAPDLKESDQNLLEIVSLAFEARYLKAPGGRSKVVKTIAFIGRVQAAWATFVEFAMHHAGCRDIDIHAVWNGSSPDPYSISRQSLLKVIKFQSNTWSSSTIDTVRKKLKSSKKSTLLLFTHAEMQLLACYGSLEQDGHKLDFFPFIGSSKRTCWLCERTLVHHGVFASRGSHGEVSAHWTFDGLQPFNPGFQYNITHALCKVQSDMMAILASDGGPKGYAIAQSTAGITTTETAATLARQRNKNFLRQKYMPRLAESDTIPEPAPKILGESRGTIRVMKLPVDGQSMEVVLLSVFAKGPDAKDALDNTIIDFSPFWTADPTDNRHSLLEVKGNGAAQDGDYRVYYTLQPELGLNEYIKASLSLDEGDITAQGRLFWRGDVIIVRHEDERNPHWQFVTLPSELIAEATLQSYFRDMWQTSGLEISLDNEQHSSGFAERFRRERALKLARLSPLEIDILHHMPMPIESTLDYLVIKDTYRNMSTRPDPNDPTMLIISMDVRQSEEDRLGWEGFSSSELPLRSNRV